MEGEQSNMKSVFVQSRWTTRIELDDIRRVLWRTGTRPLRQIVDQCADQILSISCLSLIHRA